MHDLTLGSGGAVRASPAVWATALLPAVTAVGIAVTVWISR